MTAAAGWAIAAALAIHVASHVAIAGALLRRTPAWRAPLALVLPPLAFWWAYTGGLRALAWAWLGALGAYALGVALV